MKPRTRRIIDVEERDEKVWTEAKKAAIDKGKSLSRWIIDVMAKELRLTDAIAKKPKEA